MNLLVAVIAFAGALLAIIATVALISRIRDERKGWLIAWSLTTATLGVSLAVIGTGCLIGFGATTFRVFQLSGSLLAPLWLAVGVVQLIGRGSAGRFASWLLGVAFTIVGTVIMISDRVDLEQEFTTSLPLGSRHWDVFPAYLLWAVHAGAALVLLGALILAVLRRNGDDYDADNLHAMLVLGPVGLATIGAVSFAVPGMLTIVLLAVAGAAVWYVVLRPLAPYEDEDEEEPVEDARRETRPAGRRAAPEQPPFQDVQVAGRRAVPEDSARHSGLGDLVAEYRAGEREADYAAHTRQAPIPPNAPPVGNEMFGGPATGMFMAGDYAAPPPAQPSAPPAAPPPAGAYGPQPQGNGQFGMTSGGPATGEYDIQTNEYGRRGGGRRAKPVDPAVGPGTGEFAADPLYGGRHNNGLAPMPADQAFGAPPVPPGGPDLSRGARHGQAPEQSQPGVPAFGAYGQPPMAAPETGVMYPGAGPEQAGGAGRPSPAIFGLLTVFTLLDGTGERFDRLAEETLEAVRRAEPDTLIYACHSVKSAPLQRIVYELYRDEVAYAEHQRQPHVERFVAERQSMVLATNVIELTVNAAKVMPLPTAFRI
ncbi:putative quinol monooxygenase [Streptosporangium sp. NPDC049376]|uniref:putative quinol monooxygenase n=1 Tax=Streptosporangium sp. NPDC049376 TaxID=3366192 RepID=UPI0037B30F7F